MSDEESIENVRQARGPAAAAEPPLERVERQLADYKAREARNAERAGYPVETGAWPLGYNEALKLRVVEGELDWTGVEERVKESILAREVDFNKITREQLNFVYEDIAFDHDRAVDERPARRLFDDANYQNAVALADKVPFEEQMARVRDTTRNLIEAIALDTWPRSAAIVDFGLDSQRHYEALYYPIRSDEIAPLVLDAALGHGTRLTELARHAPSNPHQDVTFHTSWDEMLGRRPGDSSGPAPDTPAAGPVPSVADILADSRRYLDPEPSHGPGPEPGRGRSR